MEEDIGLVVLEHLSDQLDIHVLNVDFLDDVSTMARLAKATMSVYLSCAEAFPSVWEEGRRAG